MATILNRQVTFATNGTVTAAGLHNLIDETEIYAGIITTQPVITSVGSSDQLLIADSDLTATSAPRRVTVGSMFNDALNNGVYTSSSFTGTLTAGSFVGPLNGNVTGTIVGTGGTISSLTTGTTTSTAANITNGTVQTLTASTANISQGSAILTQGTIATLNSTTGTIANLSATTSTFLGTITGSTNVVNIGSGQIYKDASGNVGIGTSSPANPLDISKSVAGNGIARITNLNAGTTALAGWSAYNGATSSFFGTIGTAYTTYGVLSANDAFCYVTGSVSIGADGSGGVIKFGTGTGVTERMRIDSSGNVGIGKTPTNKLDILAASNTGISISNGTMTGIFANSADTSIVVGTQTSHPINFYINNLPVAILNTGGNFGIGSLSPVNKLEITGSFGRGAPVTKVADFTLADTENWIIVNKGSAGTATLPAASSWTGREFTIKVITAHTVVSASSNVVPRNSTTAGTAILAAAAGNWATLVSNGTNWVAMCGS